MEGLVNAVDISWSNHFKGQSLKSHVLDFLKNSTADLRCIPCLVIYMTLDTLKISCQIHQKIQPVIKGQVLDGPMMVFQQLTITVCI